MSYNKLIHHLSTTKQNVTNRQIWREGQVYKIINLKETVLKQPFAINNFFSSKKS